jgi:MoaA/NifB/PqqE/SkfB family radical SAM enzyme
MSAMAEARVDSLLDELRFIWLEITEKCNLTCSHCYADSGPQGDLYGSMSFEDWSRIIDQASELGCRELQFIGGEPTLHPQLADLIMHASRQGFELIEVFTNATRLGKKMLGCMRENNVHLATSFYSDDPSVHDRITGHLGSWDRTVGGIRSLLSDGIPLRVGVIETVENLGHGERAIDFVRRLGVENVGLDRQRRIGRGSLVQLEDGSERYDELCGQCWKGRLCVTSSGIAFPCVFSRATPLGDAKLGLSEILRSPRLTRFRQEVRTLEEKRSGFTVACSPNTQCSPHNCSPNLPCAPQGPFCSPDSACGPGTTCQPTR